jgi:hypothetical protein
MTIILLILKIIGIILLILLGAVVLLLALILLVPVRYRVSGAIGDETKVGGTVSWLLRLVHISFAYEQGKLSPTVRICGIRLRDKAKDKEKEWENDNKEAHDVKAESINSETESEAVKAKSENVEAESEAAEAECVADDTADSGVCATENIDTNEELGKTVHRPRAKPEHIFERIRRKCEEIKQVVKSFGKTAETIRSELTNADNKQVLGQVWTEVLYLLKHFKFRRIETELYFSAGDPAVTGQVLGGLCVLPFLYQYDFHIYPDFESDGTYVKGTFLVKGRVRLVHVLRSFIHLIRRKEVRGLLRRLRNRE